MERLTPTQEKRHQAYIQGVKLQDIAAAEGVSVAAVSKAVSAAKAKIVKLYEDTETSSLRGQQLEIIKTYLDSLPEVQWRRFSLWCGGMSYADIAEAEGVNPTSISRCVQAVYEKMKKRLKHINNGEPCYSNCRYKTSKGASVIPGQKRRGKPGRKYSE